MLVSLLLLGLASAFPVDEARTHTHTHTHPSPSSSTATTNANCPLTICIDGLNKCGVKWGGCYDKCQPSLSPTPPPCESTTTLTTVITTTVAPTSPTTGGDCSKTTVCWDGINECGQTYGGCFPDCKPWPTFTPPPCTTNTKTPTITSEPTTTSPTSKGDDCSTRSVCWDGINECGMMYGGCFADCTPWPTFTPPPCPTTSTAPSRTKTIVSPSLTLSSTTKIAGRDDEDCSNQTVCVDYINECGMWYGDCFANCRPWPSVTAPPCPSSSKSSATPSSSSTFPTTSTCLSSSLASSSSTTTSLSDPVEATPPPEEDCPYICADYINDCGKWYGGCFTACEGEPWPVFEEPECP